jgi:high affinity Mn2+ porin
LLLSIALSTLPLAVRGQEAQQQDWNAKFQATYVFQSKRALPAAYSGQNSLRTAQERSYSLTSTAALGYRPWTGGEFYFNPEVALGVPLSGLTGLGGFTNGEIARTAGPNPRLYRARLFLRQTIGLGGGRENVEPDINQLAGSVDKRRLVLTAGNLSVIDIFDDNAYSHDPRTQFMNWSIMTHGAYDYAADARGYSAGFAIEYFHDDWAIRFGRFAQPREPNQLPLEYRLSRHYGDQLEIERAHKVYEQPGKIRLLAYRNRALMSRYEDALNPANQAGPAPSLADVRSRDRTKAGFGINLEQAIGEDLGVFARSMLSDGKTETYAFAEIDRSFSAGAILKGNRWGRALDSVGLAVSRNGLSAQHRDYLARGGLGFFIGDGRLNYKPESILETFYSYAVNKKNLVSIDYQRIANPAYNSDRGPVNIVSLRLHTEF